MTTLQEKLESELETMAAPHKVATAVIARKLRKLGIAVADAEKERLEHELVKVNLDESKIDLHQIMPEAIQLEMMRIGSTLELTDADLDEYLNDLESAIRDAMPEVIAELSANILERLKHDAPSMLEEHRSDRLEFEERLRGVWQRPLQLLEMFVAIATEAGSDFNRDFRPDAEKSDDYVFDALTRLHARACQIASEILLLLGSGYADGAHARWRSLHEIAVVSYAISEGGQEIGERYLLHDTVQRFKLAQKAYEFRDRINEEPTSQEELNRLRSKCDQLVARFGKPFKEDYGWAAALNKSAPTTIKELEEHAGLDHMRPYYRMASDNVHANSHGTYFRLGLSAYANEVLLAGPSNSGLADPGDSTAISLNQITQVLLSTRSKLDFAVASKILQTMVDEIGKAFQQVHFEVEARAKAESGDTGGG